VHTGTGTVITAIGIFVAGIAPACAADTLPAPDSGTDSRAAAIAARADSIAPTSSAAVRDSAAAVTRPSPVRRRTDTASRRDSLLQNVLRSIAQDDSAAQPAPTARHGLALRGGRAASVAGRLVKCKWEIAGAGIACLLIAIVAAALARARRKKDEKRFMTTTRLSLMDGEVQRACLFIEKHFNDASLSPASVCAGIVTGEQFLEALFERELGMGIAAYIEQVRIHRAKEVITWNPAADAQFVASQAGYAQAAAFETSFEKIAGVDFESFRRERSAAAR